MTSKQKLKQLLTTNPELIQLLNDEKWNDLMNKLPIQTRPVLFELLRECGIDETEIRRLQHDFGIMYGLKFSGSTITIGAPDKNGIHNVGNVTNKGMQGGRMLGFRTPEAAEHIASQIGNPRVYTMNPATAKNYTWIKVETIHGPAYAALEAIGKFKNLDKTLKEKSQQLHDLQRKISDAEISKRDPEYTKTVMAAAGKENVKNLQTICELVERSLTERGVEFKFGAYGCSTLDEYYTSVEQGKRSYCRIRYDTGSNVTQNEKLENGFFRNLEESIKRKLPHITDLSIYTYSNDSNIYVSFDCTSQSPEAIRAKEEVVRQAEKTIAEVTPELEKLKAELT